MFAFFLLLSLAALILTLISLMNQTKHMTMILMLFETMALKMFLMISFNI